MLVGKFLRYVTMTYALLYAFPNMPAWLAG
jgi:hypothetical protein